MEYKEQKTLRQRGAVDPLPAKAVEGTLLVGSSIHRWEENHCQYGCDDVTIAPALYNGNRSWLLSRDWCPARGYSASGEEEEILTFERGVELLLSLGAFEHLFPGVG